MNLELIFGVRRYKIDFNRLKMAKSNLHKLLNLSLIVLQIIIMNVAPLSEMFITFKFDYPRAVNSEATAFPQTIIEMAMVIAAL